MLITMEQVDNGWIISLKSIPKGPPMSPFGHIPKIEAVLIAPTIEEATAMIQVEVNRHALERVQNPERDSSSRDNGPSPFGVPGADIEGE